MPKRLPSFQSSIVLETEGPSEWLPRVNWCTGISEEQMSMGLMGQLRTAIEY
ncbi:MAG: hypothetical protein K0R57_643 [Paenibacillaceae bacterium]|jgi:hypothetical protein|nr:hypothetical protein [Paenibacillaceae bacterium]